MLELSLAWWAPLGFTVYAAVALVVGDFFPFSKYSMYASSPNRRQGAVPVLLADGQVASLRDYERISGLRSEAMYPPGLPCSLEWAAAGNVRSMAFTRCVIDGLNRLGAKGWRLRAYGGLETPFPLPNRLHLIERTRLLGGTPAEEDRQSQPRVKDDRPWEPR